MNKHQWWLMMVVFVLVGCTPTLTNTPIASKELSIEPTNAIQPSDTPEFVPVAEPSHLPTYKNPDIRIHMTTTSDWTLFRLVDGGVLADAQILSTTPEESTANFDHGQFLLTQPINQAEMGKSVELVADLYLVEGSLSENLDFEIDRGHIGETIVDILTYACGNPTPVATFTWEGIQPSGENVQSFSIPTAQLGGVPHDEYTVIAQLNFWFYGELGFEHNGKRLTPLTPLIGDTYWSSDPDVVYQQIEWAAEYGVDAFSIEWTTPRGIGCCGSMEDTLDDVFLKSPNIHKVRWVIFYDFVLRLDQTPGLKRHVGTFDFDEPDVYNTFVSDFKHFAEKYFGHQQYLTIDGRPVIIIWSSAAYVGNLEGALREAREEVAKLGYDVFIVGDEVQADRFDPYHASLFDGNTTFTFLIGGLDFFSWNDIGDAIGPVDQTFEFWRKNIQDLRVIDREESVNFQPAWAPQYDDRLVRQDHGIYVPAMSRDQVVAMAAMARKHSEPVGSQEQKLIWLNTWNCWKETTTVEPTANLGPKYPAGNYQFDMLEVVREVFGVTTYSCETP